MKKYGITFLSELIWFAISFGVVFLIYTNAPLLYVFFVALILNVLSTALYLLIEISAQKLEHMYLQRKSK